MNYRAAALKLAALGCAELPRRKPGSHRKWWNPANRQVTTVPDWGSKDLKIGTLRAIVRQLGLDWQDFLQA
jgi:predicted RNA binding protein YcfA (HicA-like mRNA interferase family)